jgi:gamma-glutamyltranspeptidase/glutathione hydrolase
VHVLTNILDYGMDVQSALDLPRGIRYEGVYRLESGVPAAIMTGLERLGHAVLRSEEPLAAAKRSGSIGDGRDDQQL